LVSVAVLAGIRAGYQRVRFQQVAAIAAAAAVENKASAPIPQDAAAIEKPQHAPAIAEGTTIETRASAPIPQDAAAIEKRRHDRLAWNRRTLQEAYDRVGKKDPRWDEPARKALDLAARMFSLEIDPQITFNDVYAAARAALDAGCDDPM